MMKKSKIVALPLFLLLASCAQQPLPSSTSSYSVSSSYSSSDSISSSSSSESIDNQNGFEETKRLLYNQISDDTIVEINERAIAQGLYKPMFVLSHSYVTSLVYPYAANRQLYYALDVSKILALDKPITSDHHASLLAQNFTDEIRAMAYLRELGYTMKNEATLPYSPFDDDMPITSDYWASSFLSRKLFIADESGILQDDAASLTQASEKEFILTLKEDAVWRDAASGVIVRPLQADDVLTGYRDTLDHGLFLDVRKTSDDTIVFSSKEAIDINTAKWAIAVSFGSPKPSSGEGLVLANEFSVDAIPDGYRLCKDGFTLYLRKYDENIKYDLADARNDADSSYFIKDRLNHGIRTYGFMLNPSQGNDAYRKAVDNPHFRKAILALLCHDEIKTLAHDSALSGGPYGYDGVSDSFSTTYISGRDFSEVIVEEGISEAAAQFALALKEGLPEDPIELYVGDVSLRKEKVELLQKLATEAFGNRVQILAKVHIDEQYYYSSPYAYPFIKGKRTFYSEIELDGFYYQTAADYLRGALSPLK